MGWAMTSDEARAKLAEIIKEAGSDLSFGLCQMSVPTAGLYGIGDGRNTPANIARVRALLAGPAVALDVGAWRLSGCVDAATLTTDPMLQALICYNSGSIQPEGNAWWLRWAENVRRYRDAIAWARNVYEEAG